MMTMTMTTTMPMTITIMRVEIAVLKLQCKPFSENMFASILLWHCYEEVKHGHCWKSGSFLPKSEIDPVWKNGRHEAVASWIQTYRKLSRICPEAPSSAM